MANIFLSLMNKSINILNKGINMIVVITLHLFL